MPQPFICGLSISRAPLQAVDLITVAAFRKGLSETGYVDGQNLAIEFRWAEGHYDRLPAMAADFVGRKVDVIWAGGTTSILAAKNATSSIPIVFAGGVDPVAPD
jgi:putative ABC transport system substrate-binding protein